MERAQSKSAPGTRALRLRPRSAYEAGDCARVAQVPGRDVNPMETTFAFKTAGETLTGTMSNQYGDREISDGKASGDDISFNVNIELGDTKMTLVFTGKVAGSEIKFRRERKGGEMGPASVEFVAKKK